MNAHVMEVCSTLRSCTHFTQSSITLRPFRGANIFYAALRGADIHYYVTQLYADLCILRSFTNFTQLYEFYAALRISHSFTQLYAAVRVLHSLKRFTQLYVLSAQHYAFYAAVRALRSFTHFTQMYVLFIVRSLPAKLHAKSKQLLSKIYTFPQ